MKKTSALKNSRGSVLIGAVALSILMAIAGIGFLQVTTASINNETAAFQNDQAFQAAESGVWIGARWLRGSTTFPSLTVSSTDIGPFGATPISINGMDVYVKIPVNIVGGMPVASIVANVYKGGSPSAATFKKRIRVGDVRAQTFGNYGTFYDGYQSTNPADNPWNSVDASWHGWGGGRIFNGRFHANTMPNFLLDNSPRFNGYVTVAQGNGNFFNFPAPGHDGNNYNYGVKAYTGDGWTPTVTELDNIFTGTYVPNVDAINLNITRNDAVSINADASLTKTNLPYSYRDEGEGPYQYRPTLYINGFKATYYYKRTSTIYDSLSWGSVNGSTGSIDGLIFVSKDVVSGNTGNNLNVYTSAAGAKGRFTIATAPGKSIVPVGNVVTSDYNVTSGTITDPTTSNNMIGLISGGYIAFNKTWTKRFSNRAGEVDTTTYVSDNVTRGPGDVNEGPADGVGTLHISASIIAVENFVDNLPSSDGGSFLNYNMKGCEWWDGMWEGLPNSINGSPAPAFNSTNNHCEDYGFHLYGNHILGGYTRTIYPSFQTVRGCAGTLEFTQDPRPDTRYMQPPGFPGVMSGTLLVLSIKNWAEENTYAP